MTKAQLGREVGYRAALSIVRKMLAQGLIDKKEFETLRAALIQTYRPVFGRYIA